MVGCGEKERSMMMATKKEDEWMDGGREEGRKYITLEIKNE